ncbi:MAG: Small GTP-binding domain protein [Promethearchaeota archaeon]|nr:MAG: Small GTP-binding domain protein [Candidatus Lokiarchaeota archaeon]
MSTKNYLFKLIIVGSAAVGKTSLLERYVNNRFLEDYKLTIGVNFMSKILEESDFKARLVIWDIGGQKRFEVMRTEFYKGASGAVLVFDLTRMETYTAIEAWLNEVRQFAGEIPFILIGNKADLIETIGRVIDKQYAEEFAQRENGIYIETSAKTGTNVEDAFTAFTRLIIKS